MRSATPSGQTHQSRRLDLNQHDAVYRTAALPFGHVGKQEREDLNPVGGFGGRFLSQEDTPVIGPRPCDRGPLA